MKSFVIATVLLALPTASHASNGDEPPAPPATPEPAPFADRPTAAGGILLTVDHFLNAAWLVEGALPLPQLPVALRASAATGGSMDADNGGDFWRLTAGFEARSCSRGGNCTFLGMDLGYQRQTWNPTDPEEAELHRGPLLGGRVGVDVGGEHVRFRAAFELYRYRRSFVEEMSTTTQVGGGFTLGLGYRM